MRSVRTVLAAALVLVALVVSARDAAAQDLPQPPAKGPIANVGATTTQVALPILNYLANDDICDSLIEVQNIGTETTALSLVVFGAPGFCPAQAAGPLKIECSGLLKPGSAWNFQGDQVPQGAKSAMLFSFSVQSLSDLGLEAIFGFDDVIADLLCETAFFGVVGDADDWRRFKLAFDQGSVYAGIPMDLAYGSPVAAEVYRKCFGPDHPGVITSKYNGIPGSRLGVYDPLYAGYTTFAPLVYADALGFESTMYIQNLGLSCSSVEVWFQQQDNCIRPYICEVVTLSPGESYQYSASDCIGPGWQGSAWLRTSQPAAIAIDHVAPGLLMTYQGVPGQINYTFDGEGYYFSAGSTVAYGPLIYSEYQGWDTGIQVQNLTPTYAAKVKVYFYDRSGDIVTTLVDWICARGSQTFYLPAIATLPGNWVGSVRVESQQWYVPGGPLVPATPISAVAQLINYVDIQRVNANQAIAYNLLAEYDAYDWQIGSQVGGRASGATVLAVPSLLKDLDSTGITTELAVANLVPKPGFTDYAIGIYDQNGFIDFVCEKLADKQVEYIDLQTWGYIHPGFKGSAIISATFWEHDVFSPSGDFLRNVVGLGAVSIERTGTSLLQNVPGDQAAGSEAIPIAGAFAFSGPSDPICPGLENAPAIPDCPLQVIRHSGNISLPIADLGSATSTLSTADIPAGCKVMDVNLDVAVIHPSNADLTVNLAHDSADGSALRRLFGGVCALTANIVTTLDDDAGATIGSVCPPVGGRYATAGNLDAFDGLEAAGDWTLQVEDDAPADAGMLLNWSLELKTQRP